MQEEEADRAILAPREFARYCAYTGLDAEAVAAILADNCPGGAEEAQGLADEAVAERRAFDELEAARLAVQARRSEFGLTEIPDEDYGGIERTPVNEERVRDATGAVMAMAVEFDCDVDELTDVAAGAFLLPVGAARVLVDCSLMVLAEQGMLPGR